MKDKNPQNIYTHRDLSWLSFNERVLEEAEDRKNPLFERLKFMAIFANNLSEFYMVRVAGIKRLIDAGYNSKDKFGWYPHDLYSEVRRRAGESVKRLYGIYQRAMQKDLPKNSIFMKKYDELDNKQLQFVKKYFENTLYPIITPLAVDLAHPFPVLSSKSLSFAVSVKKQGEMNFAIITLPINVSRVLWLPADEGQYSFILIDEVIRHNMERFFRGCKLGESVLFRVIRDSELSVEEEYEDDLLRTIEMEIKKRPNAKVVYLEVEENGSSFLMDILSENIGFPKDEFTIIKGELDLSYLFGLIGNVPRAELFYPSFTPGKIEYENIFEKIAEEGEFLLHVPYQSFQPTVDLIKTAANDKDVLAIKMTLYRTNKNSAVVQALKEAAQNKKQVTVLVEIKARFDEESNIQWVRELEEAGCHVVYGLPGMKIHSKIALIVREEEGKIQRYVHLSTGNYNEKTAEIYTDYGYFTSNEDFAKDISDVFNVITGYSVPSRWKRIMSAPYDLRGYFIDLVDKEIECQRKYGNGSIFVKMNSFEDTHMIDKIYEASKAGVKVQMLVRGICSLVPGVESMSNNVQVKSIVGRFLEHSRIFTFNNNNDERVFLSSADWMRRNFDRRIELLFEIYNKGHKENIKGVLDMYWKDNVKGRTLLKDGTYVKDERPGNPYNSQESLISYYFDNA